ncbi:MAG: patatin-like phospholipase family protein [Mycobacterium leprae]
MEPQEPRRVGIVLAGGGARGAYEAGVLSELLPQLDRRGVRLTVFLGTSIGSVNACLFASLAHLDPNEAVRQALAFWRQLDRPAVFRNLLLTAPATLSSYVAEFVGLPRPRLANLLDTTPLQQTGRLLNFHQLHSNVNEGLVSAVAVVATAAYSGRSVVFVQAGSDVELPESDRARALDYVRADLDLPHVLASSAIPAFFPAVEVTQPPGATGWYIDGGVRLNTPIAPALDLGVSHLIVIATHPAVPSPVLPPDLDRPLPQPEIDDAAVQLLDAALVDPLIEDVQRLSTVNEMVGRSNQLADRLIEIDGQPAEGGETRRNVPYLFFGPHAREDIGNLAELVYDDRYSGIAGTLRAVRSPDFPLLRRLVGHGEGPRGGDLLSYFFFDPEFIDRSIQLGRQHARETFERFPTDDIIWQEGRPRRPNGAFVSP